MKAKYGIKVAARLSGLSPYVIRAWENRYSVVEPERTETNRRQYSNEQVEHLRILRKLTEDGYPIGSIAGMTQEALRLLLEAGRSSGHGEGEGRGIEEHAEMRSALLRLARDLDGAEIERLLVEGSVRFSHRTLIEEVIAPFVQEVGRGWKNGSLRIAHEHVATAAVRNVLMNLLYTTAVPAAAPSVIVSTPQGQRHEIGALLSANIALLSGWDVTYLGADLPAEEIAASARDLDAAAVLLSIVYPPDDPHVHRELMDLSTMLPPETTIIVGGHSAAGYSDTIDRVAGVLLESVRDLWDVLDRRREQKKCPLS
jgi:DNA-binding transcriptional MerR regulator/methylmalonyl-CoA mutase cobalamin-binding subunit